MKNRPQDIKFLMSRDTIVFQILRDMKEITHPGVPSEQNEERQLGFKEYVMCMEQKIRRGAGKPACTFQNNNYANCRINKLSKSTKDGKFQYGLIDRKHTTIEKCYACNKKDVWDIIMENIEAKNKGALIEDEDEDEDKGEEQKML